MSAERAQIDGKLLRITFKAYLFATKTEDDKPIEVWVPKSQVKDTDCLAEGDTGYLIVAAWYPKATKLTWREPSPEDTD